MATIANVFRIVSPLVCDLHRRRNGFPPVAVRRECERDDLFLRKAGLLFKHLLQRLIDAALPANPELLTAGKSGDHENTKERKHETMNPDSFSCFRPFVLS
jgi:hypothetical protein